jgi:hypothetical protein
MQSGRNFEKVTMLFQTAVAKGGVEGQGLGRKATFDSSS